MKITDFGGWKIGLERRPVGMVTQIMLNLPALLEVGMNLWRSTRIGRAVNWVVFGPASPIR